MDAHRVARIAVPLMYRHNSNSKNDPNGSPDSLLSYIHHWKLTKQMEKKGDKRKQKQKQTNETKKKTKQIRDRELFKNALIQLTLTLYKNNHKFDA